MNSSARIRLRLAMTRLLTTLGLSAGLVLLLTLPVAGESVRQPVLAAIIQYRVQEPDRVGVDADRLEAFIREAASRGAKIVVTPETTFYRLGVWEHNGVTQLDLAKQYDALVRRFGALSKALRICLVIGLRKPSGDASLPVYNVAVFFGPDGTVLKEHQKIFLCDDEAGFTKGGSVTKNVQVFATPLGKVGMLICKDMDENFLPQVLVAKGMELFIGISADPGPVRPAGVGRKSIRPAPCSAPATALAPTRSVPTPDPFLTAGRVLSLPMKFSPPPDTTALPMMSKFSTKPCRCLARPVGACLRSTQLFSLCCLNEEGATRLPGVRRL